MIALRGGDVFGVERQQQGATKFTVRGLDPEQAASSAKLESFDDFR